MHVCLSMRIGTRVCLFASASGEVPYWLQSGCSVALDGRAVQALPYSGATVFLNMNPIDASMHFVFLLQTRTSIGSYSSAASAARHHLNLESNFFLLVPPHCLRHCVPDDAADELVASAAVVDAQPFAFRCAERASVGSIICPRPLRV